MSTAELQSLILHIFAFIVGCTIGSFLNVVIYRVPLGLSVNEPKRSFCPNCKTQIPVWFNIPIVTWLMLGGKCKWCKQSISPRYIIVEALTGLLFLAVWAEFADSPVGYGGAVAYCVLMALLVSATFIDFDHFIIPDSITKGGTVVGVIACLAVPQLMETNSRWEAFYMSLMGATIGFLLLWAVVNLGKLAFGKIKYAFDEPADWRVFQENEEENPMIEIGENSHPWDEVIYRKSDRLIFDSPTEVHINDELRESETLIITESGFELNGELLDLETVKSIRGKCLGATVPREAMGFGDVKFIATIGAFLGWQAVLFTVFAASVIGAVVGITQKTVAKEEWSRPLPFGPYLALGAILFLFFGKVFVDWYAGLLGFERPVIP